LRDGFMVGIGRIRRIGRIVKGGYFLPAAGSFLMTHREGLPAGTKGKEPRRW
jgi:hypothetical protein